MPDPLQPTSDTTETSEVLTPDTREAVDQVSILPLQNMFEINHPSATERHQMETIWGYLKDTSPSGMLSERLYQLRQLEGRLATPRLGETRLGKLFNYIKLDQQIKDNEKLRDTYLQ